MSPGDVRDASASSTSNKLRTAIRFSPNDYSAANKSKERKIPSFYSVFPDSRRPPPPPSPRDAFAIRDVVREIYPDFESSTE